MYSDYLSRMYYVNASEADFDLMLPISTQDRVSGLMSLKAFAPTASSLPKTPLEWNLILMGDQDHFGVLPPMSESLERCHIYNRKHCSIRETQANLKKMYPGNGIHYRQVIDFVARCPICQKNTRRILEQDTIEPISK
jgi:hypothetical protein